MPPLTGFPMGLCPTPVHRDAASYSCSPDTGRLGRPLMPLPLLPLLPGLQATCWLLVLLKCLDI